jgi:hypothetical protein
MLYGSAQGSGTQYHGVKAGLLTDPDPVGFAQERPLTQDAAFASHRCARLRAHPQFSIWSLRGHPALHINPGLSGCRVRCASLRRCSAPTQGNQESGGTPPKPPAHGLRPRYPCLTSFFVQSRGYPSGSPRMVLGPRLRSAHATPAYGFLINVTSAIRRGYFSASCARMAIPEERCVPGGTGVRLSETTALASLAVRVSSFAPGPDGKGASS